jgi:hypothetical protein
MENIGKEMIPILERPVGRVTMTLSSATSKNRKSKAARKTGVGNRRSEHTDFAVGKDTLFLP